MKPRNICQVLAMGASPQEHERNLENTAQHTRRSGSGKRATKPPTPAPGESGRLANTPREGSPNWRPRDELARGA